MIPTDLCRGDIPNTGIIKAMKVMSVAGAYWRGDEKQAVDSCLWNIIPKKRFNRIPRTTEEAKRRDHRKLGKN
jgi:threonyl-tRNA synthetase